MGGKKAKQVQPKLAHGSTKDYFCSLLCPILLLTTTQIACSFSARRGALEKCQGHFLRYVWNVTNMLAVDGNKVDHDRVTHPLLQMDNYVNKQMFCTICIN